MKKTLIALAIAASAAASGSAMAAGWEQNGNGHSVELGGMLTPVAKMTPWEVKTGDAVTGLDAQVQKGQKVVDVTVKQAIPVLGIRTQTNNTFPGQEGISPQIDFGNAINVDTIKNSEAVLTIDVKDSERREKIGTLSTSLLVGAEYSYTGPNNGKYVMVASRAGDAFFGGLPKEKSASAFNPYERLTAISGEFTETYNGQGVSWSEKDGGYGAWDFTDSSYQYSAYYASGIEKGKNITITLDQVVAGDAQIQWKASLPVIVTYM